MKKTTTYKASTINYYSYGYGSEVVFCFHGYGLNGSSFNVLQEALGHKYQLICIDFPFHGDTDWREGLSFGVHDLIAIINSLNPFPNKPFTLLGYSMGGRIGLYLLQTIPTQIKHLLLVAPDGLKENPTQMFATRTIIGNWLFKFTMKYPYWLFALVLLLAKLRLVNKSMTKFVHLRIDDKKERKVLYKIWTTLREFRPNLALIKQLSKQHNIAIDMLFGKYDKIIRTKDGRAFMKEGPLINMKEINASHSLLKEKHVETIVELLGVRH